MPNSTLNISLAEEMKQYLDERVQSCEYANADEYIAELLQRDRVWQRSLEAEIDLAIKGPFVAITDEDWKAPSFIEMLRQKVRNKEFVTRGTDRLAG